MHVEVNTKHYNFILIELNELLKQIHVQYLCQKYLQMYSCIHVYTYIQLSSYSYIHVLINNDKNLTATDEY